jgi:elongator complex protein 5
MASLQLQHRRTHNLLLISKLLNQRDAASPFTLVLDSLEQSGKPLLAEYVKRANVGFFLTHDSSFKPKLT